jgi:phytoene synthase
MARKIKENNSYKYSSDENLWELSQWNKLEEDTLEKIRSSKNNDDAYMVCKELGKKILKNYSNSFFTVTRFLPKQKRDLVEIIYASVRFPDEIVDTFEMTSEEKNSMLNKWENKFQESKKYSTIKELTSKNIPIIISAYRMAAIEKNIPDEYYLSFIDAMRKDIDVYEYPNMNSLIDKYIYGSAIVVGYFLAYIYGPNKNKTVSDLLEPSRDLGIALQLTNFARDVYEDYFRGRFYTPTNMLEKPKTISDLPNYVIEARKILAEEAEKWYQKAENGMENFSVDSQIAIKSCLELYRKLNSKILEKEMDADHRYSLTLKEKLSFLPLKKFWKLILLYI